MRLPGLFILKRRAEFLSVAGSGLYCATPSLVLQVITRTNQFPDRIGVGFTATRKVGGAVIRNRAKRRLRALAMAILPIHAHPAHDYVLVARAESTISSDFRQLQRDLERALRRLHCWRNEEKPSDKIADAR